MMLILSYRHLDRHGASPDRNRVVCAIEGIMPDDDNVGLAAETFWYSRRGQCRGYIRSYTRTYTLIYKNERMKAS